MTIADEKYMSLTTYRKSGEAVASPVWVVGLADGSVGFWTSSTSGKAKRIRNSGKITVQASDSRGRLKAGSEVLSGTARLVTTGPEMDEIATKVKAKYGFMTNVTRVLAKIGAFIKRKKHPYADTGVVITLS